MTYRIFFFRDAGHEILHGRPPEVHHAYPNSEGAFQYLTRRFLWEQNSPGTRRIRVFQFRNTKDPRSVVLHIDQYTYFQTHHPHLMQDHIFHRRDEPEYAGSRLAQAFKKGRLSTKEVALIKDFLYERKAKKNLSNGRVAL